MIKIYANPEHLLEKGVYKIVNITTGKYYIGSTIMTFLKRFQHHISMLRKNKHKNVYLQNAWNKHGEDDFECHVVEICEKSQCLIKEQYWLDTLECTDKNKSYNINPFATGPCLSAETLKKKSEIMLKKYANGELDHVKEIARNHTPWNKGIKYISTKHLKVPKTITEKLKNKLKQHSENLRNSQPEIYVYDLDMNFLGKWRSSTDLEEWSLTDFNNLPIKSRFSVERMNKPIKLLQSVNINKSCNKGKPYKGLIFSHKPFCQVTDIKKQGELLENPQSVDNQQPNLESNFLEGSTTNLQIQPGNAEDSNENKSALPFKWIDYPSYILRTTGKLPDKGDDIV